MVVDDADDVRELIALQLRLSGYDVIEARDGREAVELATLSCPSLVLMDINMPVLDGLAATRLLRQVKELCHMSIVAFSAFGSGANRQSALDAGCDEYVTKTAGISHLLEIVRRHLGAA
jgi:CheY-like chemotaxis protein